MQPQRYIKLILPLRLEWEPCYSTAAELAIGERVAVVFAHKRVIGVVSETDVTPDIVALSISPKVKLKETTLTISEKTLTKHEETNLKIFFFRKERTYFRRDNIEKPFLLFSGTHSFISLEIFWT